METLYRQLIAFTRAQPTRPRWIIVPSMAVGKTLADRLALDGYAWANLRFQTASDLALRIAGPALSTAGKLVLKDGIGPALTLQLLLNLGATGGEYFRQIAEQPGVGDALWRAVRDLRLAGLTHMDLVPAAFSNPVKHRELRALLESYENHLDENRLADMADVYREATARKNKFPMTPECQILEFPGAYSCHVERLFLDSLPGERLAAEIVDPHSRETPTTDSQLLVWVSDPGDAPLPYSDGSLSLFHAAGREAEVMEVLRRIQQSGEPLDSVEIICTGIREQVPLLWEKSARLGIPMTFEPGVPATFTRPIRAFLGFCDWIESGFSARRLSRMFEAGLLDTGEETLSSGKAARILRQSEAGLGREGYAHALNALRDALLRKERDQELDEGIRASHRSKAEGVRILAEWIQTVLDAIPAPEADGRVELGKLTNAVISFLEKCVYVGSEEDGVARNSASESLRNLDPLKEIRRTPSEQLALIRSAIEGMRLGAVRAKPGKIHVSALGCPSYTGRPVTFILGLEEGAVFPAGTEDPVLLDEERAALAPNRLILSTVAVQEEVKTILDRLTALGGRVTLSYSARDLRGGRNTFPSWLFFHAWKLIYRNAEMSYSKLAESLRDPVTCVPFESEASLNDIDWWLAGARGGGDAARTALSALRPEIARGYRAEQMRNSGVFSEYDGLVPEAGTDLDPRRPDRKQSPSGLEGYAKCPFRYFLEKGLGVEPPDDDQPDPDKWLDPLARGSLLHDIYRDFLRELRTADRRARATDWDVLWQIATKAIAELRTTLPPPSEFVFESETRQIEKDLRLFLELESQRLASAPVALEVPFGFGAGTADPEEPLSRDEAVEIEIGAGESIRLRGRIDRIDLLGDGMYEVIDYKTGRLRYDDHQTNFNGGTLLQHALYGMAAKRLLGSGSKVAKSTYWFSTQRAWGEQVSKPGSLDARPVLKDLATAISAGVFIRGGKGGGCQYCECRQACPRGEKETAEQKWSSAHPGLEALRRLETHG
jgi:ATP-dependent helicase/nuclease subunit B